MGKRYRDGDKLHAKEFNKLLNNIDENTINIQNVKNSIPRKTSQLINDSGFITKTVNNWRPVKINGIEILDNKPEKPLVLNGSENITLSTNNDVITINSNGYVYSESKNSVAEGYNTTANGNYSHAEGYGTVTTNEAEHAEGKYNISNAGTIHSIGIGTSNNARTNAVEVMSNGDVFINGIGGYDGNNVSTAASLQDVVISGGGIKLVRLTQEEYNALVSSGTIDEMTLYIIIAPSEVTATFTNYDGTVLYTQTIPYGELPSYNGEQPTRSDDYDQAENLGTEYMFYDWEPYVQPITANTTFVAQYIERQFRYVTTEKYVRETRGGLDANKDYLLVAPDLSVSGELHLAINHVFNSSRVFETMATTIYTEQTFDNLEEFTISGATPTVFLGLYPDGEGFYFRDKTDDGYIGSSTANTGSNSFQEKAYISGTDPSLELDNKFMWVLDENMNLHNAVYNRTVRYNQGSPRFAPYKSGQNTAVLFYVDVEQKKEYIDNGISLMSFRNRNITPIAYFEKYVEALPEE